MAFSSGIGTYLRNLLPRVAEAGRELEFVGLARRCEIAALQALAPRVGFRACDAGVYSAAEQFVLAASIPRGTRVFWAPHINLPVSFRGRLLVTVHDLFPYALGRALKTRLDKLFYTRAMLRLVRLRAAGVVCVSSFTKREFERFLGPFRQPVTVIHNGVDAGWFDARALPAPRQKPYVVYVGNVKPHKNVRRLVSAFDRIADRVPHHLVVIGNREGFADGESFDDPESKRLQARARLDFVGNLSDPELRRLVAHADALVLPSLYEGFGLPPLEAMACGVPALVAKAGALPEVCEDAALYCNPLDTDDIAAQLERLLIDHSLREQLVRLGRVHARRFDWDRSAELTLRALRGL
jgi:glycosyltransferase involved in cell wall biosynthesis